MAPTNGLDPNHGLARQALGRPLTAAEMQLAGCLEQIFKSGETRFEQVAVLLQQNGVQPPSGATEAWSPALLESELRLINASLDRAYVGG